MDSIYRSYLMGFFAAKTGREFTFNSLPVGELLAASMGVDDAVRPGVIDSTLKSASGFKAAYDKLSK